MKESNLLIEMDVALLSSAENSHRIPRLAADTFIEIAILAYTQFLLVESQTFVVCLARGIHPI